MAESHRLNLGEKLSITCQKTLTIYLKLKKPIKVAKKELQEICSVWNNNGKIKTFVASAGKVHEMLQPHSNLKILKIHFYDRLYFLSWVQIKVVKLFSGFLIVKTVCGFYHLVNYYLSKISNYGIWILCTMLMTKSPTIMWWLGVSHQWRSHV